jgi:hypothetical protein
MFLCWFVRQKFRLSQGNGLRVCSVYEDGEPNIPAGIAIYELGGYEHSHIPPLQFEKLVFLAVTTFSCCCHNCPGLNHKWI